MADVDKSFTVEEGITFDTDLGIWIGGGDDVPAFNAPQGSRYFKTDGTFYIKQGAGTDGNWLMSTGEDGQDGATGPEGPQGPQGVPGTAEQYQELFVSLDEITVVHNLGRLPLINVVETSFDSTNGGFQWNEPQWNAQGWGAGSVLGSVTRLDDDAYTTTHSPDFNSFTVDLGSTKTGIVLYVG